MLIGYISNMKKVTSIVTFLNVIKLQIVVGLVLTTEDKLLVKIAQKIVDTGFDAYISMNIIDLQTFSSRTNIFL